MSFQGGTICLTQVATTAGWGRIGYNKGLSPELRSLNLTITTVQIALLISSVVSIQLEFTKHCSLKTETMNRVKFIQKIKETFCRLMTFGSVSSKEGYFQMRYLASLALDSILNLRVSV